MHFIETEFHLENKKTINDEFSTDDFTFINFKAHLFFIRFFKITDSKAMQ